LNIFFLDHYSTEEEKYQEDEEPKESEEPLTSLAKSCKFFLQNTRILFFIYAFLLRSQ